jgi:cytochrome c oxidase assembly protein subunit 15
MRDALRAYRVVAIVMVVMLCTIIVSGAIVRLSNSGLGCSDWPRCEPGHFTSLGSINQRIEQFNRFYSGLIIVPIAISLILAYLTRPRRRDLVTLSWVLVVLYLFEAVLGGIAVKVDLQWFSVMTHFLLAIVLLGVGLLNLERARTHHDTPPAPSSSTRGLVVAVWCGVLAIIVLGTLVTAAGPHGGDRLHAERLTWPIEDAARTHGVAVTCSGGGRFRPCSWASMWPGPRSCSSRQRRCCSRSSCVPCEHRCTSTSGRRSPFRRRLRDE